MPVDNKTFNDVKLYVKWKKDTSVELPDLEEEKGVDDYVIENISSTIGKIVRYLDDFASFKFEVTTMLNNVIYTTDTVYMNCVTDNPSEIVHYGIRIAKNDSNPRTRVTYMYDAVGFTPAHMVYNPNVPEASYFSYGSWANAFFILNNYPCMCRYDGTEDYKLNKSNHYYKEDGSPSDVANLAYNGNAQSCFNCQIWFYHHSDAEYEYYEFSNVRLNDNFHLNAYKRADGTVANKIYYPMYKGSYDGTRLRSMSSPNELTYTYTENTYSSQPANWPYGYYTDEYGTEAPSTFTAGVYYTRTDNGVYPDNMKSTTQDIANCAANGTNWQIGDYAHRELLSALLMLISKSDNSQEAFGYGYIYNGNNNPLVHYNFMRNGSLNTKGQFFGYTNGVASVKTFFIENWWGMRWDRCLGLYNFHNEYRVKWEPPYSISDVVETIATGVTVPSTGWTYETDNTYGRLPISTGTPGSATTCTTDYFYAYNGSNAFSLAMFGGSNGGGGQMDGMWALDLADSHSSTSWQFGSSPYLKA